MFQMRYCLASEACWRACGMLFHV